MFSAAVATAKRSVICDSAMPCDTWTVLKMKLIAKQHKTGRYKTVSNCFLMACLQVSSGSGSSWHVALGPAPMGFQGQSGECRFSRCRGQANHRDTRAAELPKVLAGAEAGSQPWVHGVHRWERPPAGCGIGGCGRAGWLHDMICSVGGLCVCVWGFWLFSSVSFVLFS